MLVGVYKRNFPNQRWSLSDVYSSPLSAENRSKEIIDAAQKSGFDKIEVATKIFYSEFNIPETIGKLVSEKLPYN